MGHKYSATQIECARIQCEKLAQSLSARYPSASLSFGYDGDMREGSDNRRWSFFTRISGLDNHHVIAPARFGYFSTQNLPTLLAQAEEGLEIFLQSKLDPLIAVKMTVDDWRPSDAETKRGIPGAVFEKTFGGINDMAAFEYVIVREEGHFVPVHGKVRMGPVNSILEAADVLDRYYRGLPEEVKRLAKEVSESSRVLRRRSEKD